MVLLNEGLVGDGKKNLSFRPELIRSFVLSSKLGENAATFSKLPISDEKENNTARQQQDLSLAQVDDYQLYDPYCMITFDKASKGMNQFCPPQIPSSQFSFYESPTFSEAQLSSYLRTSIVPK